MKIIFLLLFWTLWYLSFSTRTIVAPFLPLVEDVFDINHATAGGLFLFTALGGTVALGASGFLSLWLGYKRVIAGGLAIAAASSIGLYTADTYPLFAGMLFLLGLGGGFYLPCAVPMITSIFERGYWGKAIAFHETAAGFSILSIPFIAAVALAHMPWRQVFLVFGGIFILAAIMFWIVSPNIKAHQGKSFRVAWVLKRPDFWIVAGLWISCGMASLGVYNIVPLFLVEEKGMPLEIANHYFGLSRIGGFAGQICIGFFLDRYETKKILLLLTALSGLSGVGLALSETTWLLVTMLLLQATFCVVFFPVGIMAISKLTLPEERSSFTGTIMAISGLIGIGVTPLLLGGIADVWNFQIGILVLAAINLAACIPGFRLPKI
jgi:NNP family nitrate/nitrite transporter-like MFS transporter